jgi:peptidoglycan hydrolase-like protein with peptidoglycan-binding domain
VNDLAVLIAFIWFALTGRGKAPARAPRDEDDDVPDSQLPPAWPQVVPTSLPRFPSTAWEFDNPPPPDVQQRAKQLVQPLWNQGARSYRTERTGARWITYQAQIVASGKKGVVAYRLKSEAPDRVPVPVATESSTIPAVVPTVPTEPTGPVHPADWHVEVGPATVLPPTPVPVVTVPELRRGTGMPPAPPDPAVKAVQEHLKLKPADGRFGKNTELAVKSYQKAHGLPASGVVDSRTWRILIDSVQV